MLFSDKIEDLGKSKTGGERNQISIRAQIIGLWKTGKDVNGICEEICSLSRIPWKWVDELAVVILV